MAGEKKGKAYEAFVKLALDDLKKAGVLKGDIFWDQKPKGMTIDTDFAIGRDVDHPSVIFQITHTGSAKNSDMKAWRNIGELVESKVSIATRPKCYSIAFDSVMKEALKLSQEASFDGQLVVGDQPYGPHIQSWVEDHLGTLPKDKLKKVDYMDKERGRDPAFKKLCDRFRGDLQTLLSKTAPQLNSLWNAEASRPKGKAPTAKETFVRRGLSKLLIFDDLNIALDLYKGKAVQASQLGNYAFELGLARKFGTIAKPADRDIRNVVGLLPEQTIRDIIARAPVSKMEGWIHTLRSLSHLDFMAAYVEREYPNLIDPKILSTRLNQLYSNPSALIAGSSPTGWPPKSIWLFEIILEIAKRTKGGSTSYGYAQLEKDAAKIKGLPKAGDAIYRTTIPGWVHRRQGTTISSAILNGISKVLSDLLKSTSPSSVATLKNQKESLKYAQNIIETKLCCYRLFEPLKDCIELALSSVEKESIRACFGERAGLGGQATKTTLIQSKSTLINWQSCTEGGRVHKKKELCGRAVALRYTWDKTKKVFKPRPGVKKLILVVDGTWKQGDLDTLVKAGWDEIYYPDEMQKLKAAIV